MLAKKKLMRKIEETEKALLDLSKWEIGRRVSKLTEKLTGPIDTIEQRDRMIPLLKSSIIANKAEKGRLDSNKLYLSEIIEKENPEFKENNLILSPVGSGKTHLINSLIKSKDVLLLVSTTSLKDKLVPTDEDERIKLGNRMYSTKNKKVYGKGLFNILVMTYAEFGKNIKYSTEFADEFGQIFCDEIHSLENYQNFSSSDTLLVSLLYLFSKSEKQQKFYFTATTEHLSNLKKKAPSLFENVHIFDYLKHPDIVRYMPLSLYSITALEQVRIHMKARKETFSYFNYKMFAFCRTIESMKKLEKIAIDEGLIPLVLWSTNNEEYPMSKKQMLARNYVLKEGRIPDGYDILIVNSAMQEGWDLKDERVKLVIMNTTNETEFVQACGRLRKDIDILIYRVESGTPDYLIDLPVEFLDRNLGNEEKENLSKILDLDVKNGRKAKWNTIKKILIQQGFLIKDKTIRENNKQKRVSIISIYK